MSAGWSIGHYGWPANNGGAVATFTTYDYNGSSAALASADGAVPSVSNYTFPSAVNSGLVPIPALGVYPVSTPSDGPWYWPPSEKPDPESVLLEQLAASMSRPLSPERIQVTGVRTSGIADAAQEPPVPDASDAETQSPERVLSPAAGQSQERLRRFRTRRAAVTTKKLTSLAVLIAGQRGDVASAEWCSHLSGETGTGLPSRRQARESAGFVLAAVRYRLQDAADLAWRPVDTLLESRELSNLTVVLATLVIVVFFLHRGGLNDLADHLEQVAVVPTFALAMIHCGRRYRQVKPRKREPRRRSELVHRARKQTLAVVVGRVEPLAPRAASSKAPGTVAMSVRPSSTSTWSSAARSPYMLRPGTSWRSLPMGAGGQRLLAANDAHALSSARYCHGT